ncbi:hypothetical protein [Thermithiobacillus plumbiphilus]|uniref:Histidine phosphatase family protein n=1 Tax=Thermithiobacillus plumbiphilus TaxID=1729899 RepID=A0ABU9D4Y3_9PROT
MEIILARHGRPRVYQPSNIRQNAAEWLAQYDVVGIREDSLPMQDLLAEGPNLVLASSLPRSVESARRLVGESRLLVDPLFREVGFGIAYLGGLRFPAGIWSLIAPLFWLLGWCRGAESRQAVRARAARSADLLIAHAGVCGRVMLVGHLFFNWFLARELRRRGWRRSGLPRLGYWKSTRYLAPEATNGEMAGGRS